SPYCMTIHCSVSLPRCHVLLCESPLLFMTSLTPPCFPSFFFTHPPPTETYTLSLHDALPISRAGPRLKELFVDRLLHRPPRGARSEEHTSELQSQSNLVCRLLLEKKNDRARPHDSVFDARGVVH